ncbi:hypothetical protein H8R29_23590 [Priestia megaterium]|uniref:hypothetical protein n=1 Tax=Priestia megaterium TaxID=1404 RepID=UPI000AFBEE5E|nr:hypothetical protein [Priestia megaterium]MED3805601.1 hypothetical protein [Priestia megaterium]MED4396315.1 hypothetical protein [Priestia megaterium]MED4737148.1 hypothetical protein [Priestia megaterium]NMM59855.1 hypothetical protein [Priestia megaterium]QSF27244.1 hypothetical protein H8R29_23590 [Priestia megaterium]
MDKKDSRNLESIAKSLDSIDKSLKKLVQNTIPPKDENEEVNTGIDPHKFLHEG